MNATRQAYTLIEMVVAVSIFFVATAAVMESMVATRNLSSLGAAKDQVELDASTILRSIAADLTVSGWEFSDENAAAVYSNASLNDDRELRYYPLVQVQRTRDDTFPEGFNDDLPWTRMTSAALALPALPTTLEGLPADAITTGLSNATWETSFHARSAGLVFLRSFTGTWPEGEDPGSTADASVFRNMPASRYEQLSPSEVQQAPLRFDSDDSGRPLHWEDWQTPNNHATLGVLFTSGFVESPPASNIWIERFPGQPYGVTLDAGWYDWGDVETAPIKPSWETMRRPDMTTVPVISGFTEAERRRMYMLAPQRYREYMYAVVPSPTALGLGRLVRAYRRTNATSIPLGVEPGQRITDVATDAGTMLSEQVAMVVDRVLSDDVVRIVFDTYRTVDVGSGTVTTLGVNQVRLRLFLAKRQTTSPDTVVRKVVTTTFAMRARASAGDLLTISEKLGTAPIGLAR